MANKKTAAATRLLRFLQTGRDITAAQARTRFGITNVTARVSELRKEGNAIYLNERKTSNGRVIKAYRLGTPTKLGYLGQPPVEANLNNI